MKFTTQVQTRIQALRERNYAYGISGGLLIVTIVLALKIMNYDERWVLIPQWATDQRIEIVGREYADTYLNEWAGSVARTLLTVNPATVQHVSDTFLKMAATHYGQIKPYLEAHAHEIRDNDISTVFYEKETVIHRDQQQVEVTGTFYTYFGRDKPPIIETKIFVVGWAIGVNGVILLRSFEEKKEI